jgi:hypothetical protein
MASSSYQLGPTCHNNRTARQYWWRMGRRGSERATRVVVFIGTRQRCLSLQLAPFQRVAEGCRRFSESVSPRLGIKTILMNLRI